MRTTLDIPADLLSQAMIAANVETKTKAIIIALQELVQKSKVSDLKKFKGKLNLNLDINALRSR